MRRIHIVCSNLSHTLRKLRLIILEVEDDDFDFFYITLKRYWLHKLVEKNNKPLTDSNNIHDNKPTEIK